MKKKPFQSGVFPTEVIVLADTEETVVRGGRDKFNLLSEAFQGINQIGVIGWGSQGPAQAQNLRDSLVGTRVNVKIGLQSGSQSWAKAQAAGFTEETNSLGEMFAVIAQSDLVILLISDAAQVELCDRIFEAMTPGSILGLSHGFLLGHLQSVGKKFPEHISVIGVCPKGMGPSVRRLYEQGKEVNGAGINCSFAVEQDIDGKATDIALAWAVAIGAPYVFQTTLEDEYKSDIFGERGILLGAVWGIVEALYYELVTSRTSNKPDAFMETVENITGPISKIISSQGMIGLYQQFQGSQKDIFEKAYAAVYPYARVLLMEIYDEVSSGNEIRSVVMAGDRLKQFEMSTIDRTEMWKIGEAVRERRGDSVPLIPLTAGIYVGVMMAQVDLLREKGHCWSEICNESVIEGVDSLNPYMHHNGIAHMVDNCSRTARLGTRKWGSRFEHVVRLEALPTFLEGHMPDKCILDSFRDNPVHQALAVCATMRPPVDICVI
jgi:ketol-acid reductoisomerase